MTSLEGKTCLITGATSGIGKEIALGLAEMGATVVLVGRSREKCESTVQEIGSKTGRAGGMISWIVADISSQASVRQLAKDYAAAYRRLDVLVNNAGVFLAKRTTTVDGIEYTLAVNHLAPFLLTGLLIDIIKVSNPARIITTSSAAHRGARIDFDDIQFEKKKKKSYSGFSAYSQSKLANILFTKELARRLEGTGVTANCFHPGAVRTNIMQGSNPWQYRLISNTAGLFFLTPEKGADTGIYLASSPDVEGVTGKYFVKRKQEEPSAEANDMEAAARLWDVSERLTGISPA
jgi:NAD(P)-dependent dehydrogenase (short-subunit alcohol dehydrogenase family)